MAAVAQFGNSGYAHANCLCTGLSHRIDSRGIANSAERRLEFEAPISNVSLVYSWHMMHWQPGGTAPAIERC
jgi:hypothetical protein